MWSALFVWYAPDLFKLAFAAAAGFYLAGVIRDIFMAGVDFTVKTILYKKAMRQARKQGEN